MAQPVPTRSIAPASCSTPTAEPGTQTSSGTLGGPPARIYYYFRARGKASRTNPRIGDIVVWGGGTHVGIYIGNGRAVSALTSGVRVHGVFAVTARFTAYLHTGMSSRYTTGTAPTS